MTPTFYHLDLTTSYREMDGILLERQERSSELSSRPIIQLSEFG